MFSLHYSACKPVRQIISFSRWAICLKFIYQEREAEPQEHSEPEQKLEIEDHPGPVRGFSRQRRGAVSAGPITEDEATSYVKKVIFGDG